MTEHVHTGLWPFNQNQETKRYKWRFEIPDSGREVIDELFTEYMGHEVIVVKVAAPGDKRYSVILGRHDKAAKKNIAFNVSGEAREELVKDITKKLKLSGFVDV